MKELKLPVGTASSVIKIDVKLYDPAVTSIVEDIILSCDDPIKCVEEIERVFIHNKKELIQ